MSVPQPLQEPLEALAAAVSGSGEAQAPELNRTVRRSLATIRSLVTSTAEIDAACSEVAEATFELATILSWPDLGRERSLTGEAAAHRACGHRPSRA